MSYNTKSTIRGFITNTPKLQQFALVGLMLVLSFSLTDINYAVAAAIPPTVSSMPGESGLLTSAPNPPALKVSAANAATTITNPLVFTEASPLTKTRGAHLNRTYYPGAATSDSMTPANTNSFQAYSVEIKTDAPKLEVRYRGGGRNRIWVNDKPISVNPTVGPVGSAYFRTIITFPTREVRKIRYEQDAARFADFTVSKTDQVLAPAVSNKRAVIIGDSFTEGTGANGRFNSYGQTLCLMTGWDDCWVSGSGGTGYINTAAQYYPGRVKFRDRIVHDALKYNPDVIVIAGGKNDGSYPASQVQAEALALFTQIRTALPNVELIVTSPFPSSGSQAQSATYKALNTALKTSATGLADHYLDVTGANAYMTGTGNVAAPKGNGNADIYTSADGVHPSPAGHDALAHALFARYTAQLQP